MEFIVVSHVIHNFILLLRYLTYINFIFCCRFRHQQRVDDAEQGDHRYRHALLSVARNCEWLGLFSSYATQRVLMHGDHENSNWLDQSKVI